MSVLGEKEDIRLVPSIVGGDPEKRNGIVLAKSGPAKKYGIQTGEPVAARLRSDGVMAGTVCVHLTSCEFQRVNKQMQLAAPTNGTMEIYAAACLLFGMLWDAKRPLRQIGIQTSKVQENVGRQSSIFDTQKSEKLEKLEQAIDKIRGRYGEDAVFRASFLRSNVSHMSGGLSKERRSGVTLGIDIMGENVKDR